MLTRLIILLATADQCSGRVLGKMEHLGFHLRSEVILQTLTLDVLKNSEMEDEILDVDQVPSSTLLDV